MGVGRFWTLFLVAGCRTILGVEDPTVDCVIDGIDLCAQTPDAEFTIRSTTTFDTGSNARCRVFVIRGSEVCLIYATEVAIFAGATLVVVGPRPFVLASGDDISIEGFVDGSSVHGLRSGPAASSPKCGLAAQPESDLGGGAGGAGGSFGGRGGNGGTGDIDQSVGTDGVAMRGIAAAMVAQAPSDPRAGCRGSRGGNESEAGGAGGTGGDSGGALWFVSARGVEIGPAGLVRANGAGGGGGAVQAGGGGGGSGGLVRIAAQAIVVDGRIAAHGGGGGEGGVRIANPMMAIPGNAGMNGGDGAMPASGGSGASVAGDGGDGSYGEIRDGGHGLDNDVGAGGGGGGAGVIVLDGIVTGAGIISPGPS